MNQTIIKNKIQQTGDRHSQVVGGKQRLLYNKKPNKNTKYKQNLISVKKVTNIVFKTLT